MPTAERAILRGVLLLLALAALVVMGPLWGPLVLAAWVAHLADPLTAKLERRLRTRGRAAVAVTTMVLVLLVLPTSLVVIALIVGATELWQAVKASGGQGALAALVSGSGDSPIDALKKMDARAIAQLASEHGASALRVAASTLGASAAAMIGVLVFILGVFTFSSDGERFARWARGVLPLPDDAITRLADAFFETGRGLIVGSGLTALSQGIVAGIAYVSLGVPRAFVLGVITAIAALIPTFGTAIVWIPIALGLALSGQTVKAIILAGVGMGVISSIDNVLRPVLSRYGKLKLPTFVLLLSVFGGLALAGGWGLVLGPLLVRLGLEALEIARDRKVFADRADDAATRS